MPAQAARSPSTTSLAAHSCCSCESWLGFVDCAAQQPRRSCRRITVRAGGGRTVVASAAAAKAASGLSGNITVRAGLGHTAVTHAGSDRVSVVAALGFGLAHGCHACRLRLRVHVGAVKVCWGSSRKTACVSQQQKLAGSSRKNTMHADSGRTGSGRVSSSNTNEVA